MSDDARDPDLPPPRDALDRELEAMLAEAEATVATLRRELAARRASAASGSTPASAAEQHAEIDRLAEHLARAQVRWNEVRAFFEEAVRELIGDRRHREGDHGNG